MKVIEENWWVVFDLVEFEQAGGVFPVSVQMPSGGVFKTFGEAEAFATDRKMIHCVKVSPTEAAIAENPCPSRCPDCRTRRLKDYGWIMDTFERPHLTGWQCLDCGRVWEGQKIGKTWRYRAGAPRPVRLAPGELKSMIDDNYKRSGIKRRRGVG